MTGEKGNSIEGLSQPAVGFDELQYTHDNLIAEIADMKIQIDIDKIRVLQNELQLRRLTLERDNAALRVLCRNLAGEEDRMMEQLKKILEQRATDIQVIIASIEGIKQQCAVAKLSISGNESAIQDVQGRYNSHTLSMGCLNTDRVVQYALRLKQNEINALKT